MRIHITYTGGTIGMIDSSNGLIPGADTRGWLFRLLEDAHMDSGLFSFTELDPLIDSSNATPDNWQTMIDDLRTHADDADAFVVLHGTDTMSYSSVERGHERTIPWRGTVLRASSVCRQSCKQVIELGVRRVFGAVHRTAGTHRHALALVCGRFRSGRMWLAVTETVRTP